MREREKLREVVCERERANEKKRESGLRTSLPEGSEHRVEPRPPRAVHQDELSLFVSCAHIGLCDQFYHYRFYQLGPNDDLSVSYR